MKKKTFTAMLTGVLLASLLVFIGCAMEVADQLDDKPIQKPYISVQPTSASYFTNSDVKDLFAQVWDWKTSDGTLSYQWYTFTDAEMIDFISEGSGSPVADAAEIEEFESDGINVINIPLSLTGIQKTANRRYYFYLEITNEDRTASDTRKITARSDIVTIAFSAVGSALLPIVNKHPVSATYQFARGLIMENLSVRAASADSGDLTYQWYYNQTGYTGAAALILIPGATNATYGPTMEVLSGGDNFFFVRVTSTNGLISSNVLSVPSVITMKTGASALEPVILKQPNDAIYLTSGTVTVQPLFVDVEPAADGGNISIQWYTRSAPPAVGVKDTSSGTIISGAGSDEFTPTNTAPGTYYYYAVVSNTNPNASRVKTVTRNTRLAKVVFAAPGSNSNVNVTIQVEDPRQARNRYQYVRGYGGMDVAWSNFPRQTPDDMELMYNPDWGLGYNINRIMIPPSNTNINVAIKDLVDTHRPNYYENAMIVNKYNGYNAAAPWSPPKEWKSNNSINGGGHLVHSYYQQYANYLRAYAKHMYDAGAPIYAVSIQNEPNYAAGYDGCEWTPEEMRDFFIKVGNFTRGIRGWGGGREIPNVLTMNGESANTPKINTPALVNPISRASIDFYSRHIYGSPQVSLWRIAPNGNDIGTADIVSHNNGSSTMNNILKKPDGTFFEVWMTEHNINSASVQGYYNDSTWNYIWRYMNDVDLVMRLNNENAFVWWASKRFYSMIGDGQYGTRDGAPLPRGYGLSHYAKYTIDTHRIAVGVSGTFPNGNVIEHTDRNNSIVNNATFNLDNNTVRITAFAHLKSGSNNQPVRSSSADWNDVEYISLVMMTPTSTDGTGGRNAGNIEIKMPTGFIIGGVSAHKSTSASNAFAVENVEVSQSRTSAFVTLGAGQLLSVKLTRQE